MEYVLRVDVFQYFAFLIDTDVDCINQIAIFDGHDLVLEIHKYDVFGVVLDAQLSLHIVHDVVHPIQLSGANLFSLKIDLKAPEYETLLALLGLFEEDIDDIVDRWWYSQ